MATALVRGDGRILWAGKEDSEGHREYAIEFLIKADKDDGPQTVRNTAGLPLPGAPWAYGNDNDPVARCKRDCQMDAVQRSQEATDLWKAKFVFTTKPDKRCQDQRFEDPLTEPQKISGSWTKYKEEATTNRYGIPLKYSSHERMKGPQIEFDKGLATVRIEQNVLNLDIPLMSVLMHTVNSVAMWGLPPRCVKLSGISWSQEFYGLCNAYYKRIFEFDINPDTFDREVADIGHKVLNGRWEKPGVWRVVCIGGDIPDRKNPAHFVPFKFPDGTQGETVLNGKGLPAGVCVVWDECEGQTLRGKMLGCPQEATSEMESTLTTGGALPYTNYYVSAFDNVLGVSLQDEDIWLNVPLTTTVLPLDEFTIYRRGQMVRDANGGVWISWMDSRGVHPLSDANSDEDFWLYLGVGDATGTASFVPNDRGTFDWCATYNLGDMVKEAPTGPTTGSGTGIDVDACDKTTPGKIKVVKYAEGNLFLLGIPTVLG